MSCSKIRWSPKVRQSKVRKLYESDALGLLNEDLLEDVGLSLLMRCQSIIMVYADMLRCPDCSEEFICSDNKTGCSDIIRCPQCGWETTETAYHNSWRTNELWGGCAINAFDTFVNQYGKTTTPKEKLILIDQLIHSFHQGLKGALNRSASNNLIEGSHNQVIEFLDSLSYGENSSTELRRVREEWKANVEKMWMQRRGS